MTILATRMLNQWLGTAYTLEEVAEMDSLLFDMVTTIGQSVRTKPKALPKGKRGHAGSS